jgi:hypothetical protein
VDAIINKNIKNCKNKDISNHHDFLVIGTVENIVPLSHPQRTFVHAGFYHHLHYYSNLQGTFHGIVAHVCLLIIHDFAPNHRVIAVTDNNGDCMGRNVSKHYITNQIILYTF